MTQPIPQYRASFFPPSSENRLGTPSPLNSVRQEDIPDSITTLLQRTSYEQRIQVLSRLVLELNPQGNGLDAVAQLRIVLTILRASALQDSETFNFALNQLRISGMFPSSEENGLQAQLLALISPETRLELLENFLNRIDQPENLRLFLRALESTRNNASEILANTITGQHQQIRQSTYTKLMLCSLATGALFYKITKMLRQPSTGTATKVVLGGTLSSLTILLGASSYNLSKTALLFERMQTTTAAGMKRMGETAIPIMKRCGSFLYSYKKPILISCAILGALLCVDLKKNDLLPSEVTDPKIEDVMPINNPSRESRLPTHIEEPAQAVTLFTSEVMPEITASRDSRLPPHIEELAEEVTPLTSSAPIANFSQEPTDTNRFDQISTFASTVLRWAQEKS